MKNLVILIGAARSGTKLLRDLLGEHPDVSVVPYDVNYLWRAGSEGVPDDALVAPLPERAVDLVRQQIDRSPTPVVIEKTVSNCLRVPATSAAFPDARFVFLTRDGFDVTESSMRQWTAPVDWRYSLKKATQYPWLSAPGYAVNHLLGMTRRNRGATLPTWGPRYPGIDDDVASLPLHEVCARQWAACNRSAVAGFSDAGIDPISIRYERLVSAPIDTLNNLFAALDLSPLLVLRARVTTASIGQGRRVLTAEQVHAIEPIIDDVTELLR